MDHRELGAIRRRGFEGFNERAMTLTIEFERELDSGGIEDFMVSVPARYVVCPTCRGRGTHVNPAIDSHGISAEEWHQDWDDEDRVAYQRGGYDVPCYECGGLRVTPEILESGLDPLQQMAVQAWYDRIATDLQHERMCQMERM